MSISDSGGFDVVLNVTAATVSGLVRASMAPLSTAFPVPTNPYLRGSGSITATIASVAFAPGNLITVSISLAGSNIVATEINRPGTGWLPVSNLMGTIQIGGTVTVTDSVAAVGMSVVTAGRPAVTVVLDDAFLKSPVVDGILIPIHELGGEAAYFAARQILFEFVSTTITSAIGARLATLGPIVLARTPVLPGPCPPPFSALAVSTTATSLRLLLTITGSPGNPALIARDWLALQPLTGLPLDAAYLVFSNRMLLQDLLRCTLITAGFPATGFLPSEPCFFVGTAPITLAGVGPLAVGVLAAGIDEAGLLRLNFTFSVSDPFGAVTVTGSVSQGFALVPSPPSLAPTITISPSGPPTLTTQVNVAGWVYVASFFTGGATLVTVLAAADLIVDALTSGILSSAIAGFMPPVITVPISLPAGAPPVAIRTITTLQSDAPQRFMFGTVIPSPFRDHDVIINLI